MTGGNSHVFAFILLSVLISCSGEIIRSLEAITNQLGLECQAAVLIGVPRIAPCVASCVVTNVFFSSSEGSCAKSSLTPFGVNRRKPSSIGRISQTQAWSETYSPFRQASHLQERMLLGRQALRL